jgi:hypothetical protein
VKLHIASWINYDEKAPKLIFYNDENDYIQPLKRPRKPRKSKYESQEAFDKRVINWEANLPYKIKIKLKGNSITQKYYV